MAKKGLGAAGANVLTRTRPVIPTGITPTPDQTTGQSTTTNGIVAALRSDPNKTSDGGVLELPIADVAEHPDNPRAGLGDLAGLASSISELGVLQPILVTPAVDFIAEHPEHTATIGDALWVVAAGHRRRAASVEAGKTTIPAIVRPQGDRIGGYVTFIDENVHRANLDPLEEARGYSLLADAGLSQRNIATRLRVSQAQVSKRLALLKLPQPVQDAIATGTVSVADALSLTAAPVEDQMRAWEISQTERILVSTAVERVERARANEAAVAKARRAAEKAGDPIIEDPRREWANSHQHRITSDDQVDQARRDGTLRAHPTTQGPVYYTTEPVPSRSTSGGGAAADRERRKAMKARTAAAAAAVVTPPTAREATAALTRVALAGNLRFADCLKLAHQWLGDRCGDTEASSMYAWRDSIQTGDAAPQTWVAWAMTVAADELAARDQYSGGWGPREKDYLALLVDRAGYEPTPWETARLDSIPEGTS